MRFPNEYLAKHSQLQEGLKSITDPEFQIHNYENIVIKKWKETFWAQIGCDIPPLNDFIGLLIGMSRFGDEIYLTIQSPWPKDSIIIWGPDISGPAGGSEFFMESALLLAADFPSWVEHLAACDWVEYGIIPGSIQELPMLQQKTIRQYYGQLNPHISWR